MVVSEANSCESGERVVDEDNQVLCLGFAGHVFADHEEAWSWATTLFFVVIVFKSQDRPEERAEEERRGQNHEKQFHRLQAGSCQDRVVKTFAVCELLFRPQAFLAEKKLELGILWQKHLIFPVAEILFQVSERLGDWFDRVHYLFDTEVP